MTQKMMKDFKVNVLWDKENIIEIPKDQVYQAQNLKISADASSATPFFCLTAINSGSISVEGLDLNCKQPDLAIIKILETMGAKVISTGKVVHLTSRALNAISIDMINMTDIVPCLAMTALFAKGKSKLNNIQHIQYKESNRIDSICKLLKLVGARFELQTNSLHIEGGTAKAGAILPSFNDHRIAMAGSLLGSKLKGTEIINPDCVSKTYPNYFNDFLKLLNNHF